MLTQVRCCSSRRRTHAPSHPNDPRVLADLDPELHGLPLSVPSAILGEGEEHGASGLARAPVGNVLYRSAVGLQWMPQLPRLKKSVCISQHMHTL